MHFHSSPSRPQSGFALLVTITLVAFLVLLLVSMATLTRVETQVATNGQHLAQARGNALMALNLAIGQLQTYAGHDQRITAPSNAGTAAINPDRSEQQPHWTGVWRNTTPTADIASRQLLTWLVSGNEDSTAPQALNPSATIADPSSDPSTVWLVHDNSVIADTGANPPDKRIKLPKQPLKADAVPGLATVTGGHTIGHYAWWVGDEGVKARVNLTDPHANSPDDIERGFSFVASQHASIARLDRSASTTELGDLYPTSSDTGFDALGKITALSQLPFASSDPIVMSAAAKARFHDLTSASYGVLADVAQGGLKKDLSRALAPGATVPADTDPIFTVNTGDGDYDVPRWELLRSYAATQIAAGSSLPPQPAQPRVIGSARPLGSGPATLSPVVTYAALGVDFLLQGASSATPQAIDAHVFPCVVLWNPYSVPLEAKNYTLLFMPSAEDAFWVDLTKEPSYGISPSVVQLWLDRPFRHAGNNTPRHCRFKIVSPVIPAGQSLIFTLPASLRGIRTPYNPGLNELVNEINPDVSVVLPTNATAASTSENYRIFARDSTREQSVVLSDFDPSGTYNPLGTAPYERTPRTSAPLWYQTIQRVNPVYRDYNYLAAGQPLGTFPPSGPAFAWEISAAFSTGTHFDSQWIAHENPRAPVSTRAINDGSGTLTGHNTAYVYRSRRTASLGWPGFNHDTTPRASAGQSLDNNSTPQDVVLFEVPSPTLGLLSLGQLQHAPVSLVGLHPAYPIGNSLAPIRMPRDQATLNAGTSTAAVTKLLTTHYDLSWKLNRALWDRYFFSTVPSGAAPSSTRMHDGSLRPAWTQTDINADNPLPNARLHYHQRADAPPLLKHILQTADADSDPYNQAAAHLLVAGAFNINSTSEQAWRAVLAGTFGLGYRPETRAIDTTTPLKAAFPRFAAPTSDDALSAPWSGYRQLDEVQIRQLAANIVAEVKTRGPFLSLADFVNRNLALDATGLKGTLQAALDATTSGAAAANTATTAPFDQNLVATTPAATLGTFYFDHMRNDTTASAAAHHSRNAFAPKFLTQADLLTALGPVLSARSDTFRIRAYGETVNPLLAPGDPGYITARSWCEAIVQRTPDYVNPVDSAEDTPTHADNIAFGRRFKIVSLRWLGPSDI